MKKQKEVSLSEMSQEEISELTRDQYVDLCVKAYFKNPTSPVQFNRGKPIFHNEKDVNEAIVMVKKGLRQV